VAAKQESRRLVFVTGIFVGIGISLVGASIGYYWAQHNYNKDFGMIKETLTSEDSTS
jgi:hypothetical protein